MRYYMWESSTSMAQHIRPEPLLEKIETGSNPRKSFCDCNSFCQPSF
jgi:hypothetical protein